MGGQNQKKSDQAGSGSKRRLLRDVLVFQFKLAMDGLRDLILSPLSILLAIAGALTKPSNPAEYFQWLMKFGRKSDDFINLFNHNSASNDKHTPRSDDYVDKIETLVSGRIKKQNSKQAHQSNDSKEKASPIKNQD